MELVRNKASGKTFIVLEDLGEDEFLVITPDGKVKKLEKHLFSAMDGASAEISCINRHVSEAQVYIYCRYFGEDGGYLPGCPTGLSGPSV